MMCMCGVQELGTDPQKLPKKRNDLFPWEGKSQVGPGRYHIKG